MYVSSMKKFESALTNLKSCPLNNAEIKRRVFFFCQRNTNTCYSTGVGSSIGCFINFHNIFQLASCFPSSFVVSTSLLIYVVLYKNELLSNLYVLLIKVLCFATSSSSSYPFSSSSSKPQNTRAILPRLSHGPLFRVGFLDLVD